MFLPRPFVKSENIASCMKDFGEAPRFDWAFDEFGGREIQTEFKDYSNIVFSNGMRDPWASGGVTKNVTAWEISKDNWKSIALYIPEAGHHLDLRPEKPTDPDVVKGARATERFYIDKWIKEYRQAKANPNPTPKPSQE